MGTAGGGVGRNAGRGVGLGRVQGLGLQQGGRERVELLAVLGQQLW